MKKIRGLAIAFGAGSLLGGCTTALETRPAYEQSSQTQALRGYDYTLPMLQYEVTLSYKLAKCPTDTEPMKLVVKASAASSYVAGESYTVDYAALSSPMKVTDFAIQTYKVSGTLQSINASAEDKTGDVIKSAIDLAIKTASLASPVKPPAFGQSTAQPYAVEAKRLIDKHRVVPRRRLACSQKASDKLADFGDATSTIRDLTKAANDATRELGQIETRAKLEMPFKGEGKKPSDQERLYQLHESEAKRIADLAVAQEKLAKAEEYLSYSDTRNWPTDPFTPSGELGVDKRLAGWAADRFTIEDVKVIDAAAVREDLKALERAVLGGDQKAIQFVADVGRVVEDQIVADAASDLDLCAADESASKCVERQLVVTAELVPAASPPGPCPTTGKYTKPCVSDAKAIKARDFSVHKGIFIRQPVRARLVLCDRRRGCEETQKGALYRSGWDTAPQLGQLRFIGLENGPFQNNSLSVMLREDGTVEKLQYAEKSAVAAGMMASAAAIATGAKQIQDDREKEREEAKQKARAEVTYRRAEVTYQRSEAEYQRTQTNQARTDAAAIRADELAQLQYQIDMLTKQKALIAQQTPVVSPEFANETILLEAQLAQLRAQVALFKAQEEYAGQKKGS